MLLEIFHKTASLQWKVSKNFQQKLLMTLIPAGTTLNGKKREKKCIHTHTYIYTLAAEPILLRSYLDTQDFQSIKQMNNKKMTKFRSLSSSTKEIHHYLLEDSSFHDFLLEKFTLVQLDWKITCSEVFLAETIRSEGTADLKLYRLKWK